MQALLKIVKGRNVGKSTNVSAHQSITIGRSVSADFQVHDQAVSRRHCTISIAPNGCCQLTDLGSANGTFINGQRSTQSALRAGDELRVGSTLLSVSLLSTAIDGLSFCSKCGRSLSSSTMADGNIHESNGQLLCPDCRPRQEYPVIGDYRVLEFLGRGSMGTVYLGESISTGLRVALKALALDKTQNEKCVKRFIQEAKLSASLQHPAIVRTFDIIEAMGTYCLVMEYVNGGDVVGHIEKIGQLPVHKAGQITRQIASALQHAFEHKIIHRDVKPHNILLTPEGQAKLVDFGIAKNLEQSGLSRITAPGQHLGTLSYMSPEQLRNALSADQRSDIYSLGATLYHMLAGVPPVSGRDFEEVVVAILDVDPPPLRKYNVSVPQPLIDIMERSMKKEPDQRYTTPGEFEADLLKLGF